MHKHKLLVQTGRICYETLEVRGIPQNIWQHVYAQIVTSTYSGQEPLRLQVWYVVALNLSVFYACFEVALNLFLIQLN